MSLNKTLQAFKEHLHHYVDESVFIEDPSRGNTGLHIYVYWVGIDPIVNMDPQNKDLAQIFHCLIFSNDEFPYTSIDRVAHALHKYPFFELNGEPHPINRVELSSHEIAEIYKYLKLPYRLSLAYEVRYVIKDKESISVPTAITECQKNA